MITDKRFESTAGLLEIAKEAGFVVSLDKANNWHVVIGNETDLRRFYQLTAGRILLDQLMLDAEKMGLYNDNYNTLPKGE
jgi:hypothetical protein